MCVCPLVGPVIVGLAIMKLHAGAEGFLCGAHGPMDSERSKSFQQSIYNVQGLHDLLDVLPDLPTMQTLWPVGADLRRPRCLAPPSSYMCFEDLDF